MSNQRSVGFKYFATPSLGVILYWIIAAPILFAAVVSAMREQWVVSAVQIGMALALRVVMEAVVVLFQIHDVLTQILARIKSATDEPDPRIVKARALAAQSGAHTTTVPGESRLG